MWHVSIIEQLPFNAGPVIPYADGCKSALAMALIDATSEREFKALFGEYLTDRQERNIACAIIGAYNSQ